MTFLRESLKSVTYNNSHLIRNDVCCGPLLLKDGSYVTSPNSSNSLVDVEEGPAMGKSCGITTYSPLRFWSVCDEAKSYVIAPDSFTIDMGNCCIIWEEDSCVTFSLM